MKTRKIRLVALLVLAAMMIIAIPVISSAEADPWANVNPTTQVMSTADKTTAPTITVDGSTVMKRQQSTVTLDYNFQMAFPVHSQPSYTFSFSIMAEAGQKIAPMTYRERGYSTAGTTSGSTGRSDANLVSVASNGDIRAYSSKSTYTVIGHISTEKLTNITVCVDRPTLTISFFIDGALKHTVPVPTDGSWIDAHKTWTHINISI